jgi:hypothetical protein
MVALYKINEEDGTMVMGRQSNIATRAFPREKGLQLHLPYARPHGF